MLFPEPSRMVEKGPKLVSHVRPHVAFRYGKSRGSVEIGKPRSSWVHEVVGMR